MDWLLYPTGPIVLGALIVIYFLTLLVIVAYHGSINKAQTLTAIVLVGLSLVAAMFINNALPVLGASVMALLGLLLANMYGQT